MLHVYQRHAHVLRSDLAAALTDQALVSIGNFTLKIILARLLPEKEYGAFAVLLSMALFLNGLHQGLVLFPLSADGAIAARGRFAAMLNSAIGLTLLLAPLGFAVMAGAALSISRAALIWPACLFLLLWQIQESWRRGLISKARFGAAIASVSLRYLAPVLLLALAQAWLRPGLHGVFLLLAAASLLAALPAFGSVRPRFAGVMDSFRTYWPVTRPLLLAALLSAFTTQWFLWLLAWRHDLTASATLVALTNALGFVNPVMIGMENMMVPEIARRRAEQLPVMGSFWRRLAVCALLLAPFLVAVLIWPAAALHLLYGHARVYDQFTLALRLLVPTYAALLLSYAFAALLRGFHDTAAVFRMRLAAAVIGLTFGTGLTLGFGVTGACLAAMLAACSSAAYGYYLVNRLPAATPTL